MSGVQPSGAGRTRGRTMATGGGRDREELANVVTHGIGLLASIAAAAVLIVYASLHGDAWKIVGISVFATTLIALYGASTAYHAARRPERKARLKIFDHAAIYLLIAGTYTPFILAYFSPGWTWTMLSLVWGIALAGIVFKIFFIGRFPKLSTGLYVAMGWLIVLALDPLLTFVPTGCLLWLAAGGAAYTGGVVFFAWDSLPYNHAIWHLFVLAGSICHYVAVVYYVL